MQRRIKQTLAGLLIAASSMGCGYQPRPIPTVEVDKCEKVCEVEGTRIGIERIDTEEENNRIFQYNLAGRGVLPILIVIENKNLTEDVILNRNTLQFEDSQKKKWDPITGAYAINRFKVDAGIEAGALGALLGAISGGTGGIVAGLAVGSKYQAIGSDWQAKTLPNEGHVAPQAIGRGFAYFFYGENTGSTRRGYLLNNSDLNGAIHPHGLNSAAIPLEIKFDTPPSDYFTR